MWTHSQEIQKCQEQEEPSNIRKPQDCYQASLCIEMTLMTVTICHGPEGKHSIRNEIAIKFLPQGTKNDSSCH